MKKQRRKKTGSDQSFGAISTVKEWVFVRYDGTEWIEARSLMIASFDDRDGMEKLVEALFHIFDYQNRQVQELVSKYIK